MDEERTLYLITLLMLVVYGVLLAISKVTQ